MSELWSEPQLAVIIVSWNVRQWLQACLTSVCASLRASASTQGGRRLATGIWVVDNHSTDGSVDMVRERFPQVHLIANTENKGFAGGNNQGIEQALEGAPRYVMLLNPDTEVRDRALETLVRFMDHTPNAGMAGARLVYGDGTFQHSGFGFPGLMQVFLDLFPLPTRLQETRLNGRYPRSWYAPDAPPFLIDHPLGATMMVRREVIDAVGLLDPGYFMYCEEIDWAMRIRAAGWDIYCVPAAEVVHHSSRSTSQVRIESLLNIWRSRLRLYRKHYRPAKVWVAGWLVRVAMMVRARQADSERLRTAYQDVAAIWSQR